MNSDHSRKLELECMRLASGIQLGGGLGPALVLEILRTAAEQSAQHGLQAARKLELECLRMAADCMQLAGDVRIPNLQRQFLELARRLTDVAEAVPAPVCRPAI